MNDDPLNKLRAICLALPEAVEGGGVGDSSFKVRDKIFAMQHPMNGRPSVWCKGPRGLQEVLVGSDPDRFFVPPYVGQHSWIGFWLDVEIDWNHIAGLVEDSYRMTAPKRLVAQLGGRSASGSQSE
jgi:predicted DNA-binding protein (MmcQ/YjbR family)